MKVIVDSGAFIALYNIYDSNHKKAVKHSDFIKENRALLFTNDYVLDETYTRLIYDIHLKSALKFRQFINNQIEKNQLTILEVEPKTRENAWKFLSKYSDHKLSFTDGTIVSHFNEYSLDEFFTFDRHFRDINLLTNLG